MKEHFFDSKIYHVIFIIILTAATIIILPFIITQSSIIIEKFSNTGQIGDTFGGIMGPFIAIIGALLTFFAFWVQYKANIQQRKDIQIERFENNFFNFIQLLNNQISNSYIENVGNNNQSFHFMFYEFKSIYFYINEEFKNKNKEYMLKVAYSIFINGISKSATTRIEEENKRKKYIKEINNYFYDFNTDIKRKGNGQVQYLRDYQTTKIKLFDGHRLRLVPFYRSICIILKYIYDELNENKSLAKNEKEEKITFYINLLCSQLSEHQIALLKIIHLYSNKSDHKYFIKNKGVEIFFHEHIKEYLNSSTMDCEKW